MKREKKERERKQEKELSLHFQYGVVFSLVHLGALLATFTAGRVAPRFLKVSRMAFISAVSLGVITIAFGFLDYVQDKSAFLSVSYVLRLLEGLTDGALWVSILSTMIHLYPDHVGAVMSYSDTVYSVAEAVGPAVGGRLEIEGGSGGCKRGV